MFKTTLLLATFIFLILAPQPDAKDISEMTAKLIVPENHAVLLAAND